MNLAMATIATVSRATAEMAWVPAAILLQTQAMAAQAITIT